MSGELRSGETAQLVPCQLFLLKAGAPHQDVTHSNVGILMGVCLVAPRCHEPEPIEPPVEIHQSSGAQLGRVMSLRLSFKDRFGGVPLVASKVFPNDPPYMDYFSRDVVALITT